MNTKITDIGTVAPLSPPQEVRNRTLIWRGSILPKVLPRVALYTALAILVLLTHTYTGGSVPFGLFTFTPDLVLGMMLVFRTNTAYDRFWEGRKAWETIVSASRNITRQLLILVVEQTRRDKDEKRQAVKLIPAYAFALKAHLRGQANLTELENFLSPDRLHLLAQTPDRPITLLFWLGDYLRWQYQQQRLSSHQFATLERGLSQLIDALGVCERILRTPLPFAYSVHLRHILMLYCVFFPFRLVSQLGWVTVPVTAIASFVVLGIEEIALEIENPFGKDANDLPLAQFCNQIAQDVERLLSLESGHNLTDVADDVVTQIVRPIKHYREHYPSRRYAYSKQAL